MQPRIQWYPGHIGKYERELGPLLKLVDVVIEVLDARMPQATINPRLEKRIADKPILVLLNKSDLADPLQTKLWKKRLAGDNRRVLLYDAKSGQAKQQVIQQVMALGEPVMKRLEARGRKRRPIRVLVAGMPNVGKSSIINSIVGKKKTQTGHRAGVTRQSQWVRIHPAVELLDSPGVIPPYLESDEAGALLATVSSVGEAAYDEEEIARFLIERIESLYPGLLREYFKLDAMAPLSLESIAESRHYKQGGDTLDTLRAAQAVLTDFRHARTGRISLEHASPDASPERETAQPQDQPAEESPEL